MSKELKSLAEAATPGRWDVDRLAVLADTRSLVCCGQAYLECCGNPDVDGDEYDPICSATSESDAAYIAAANPAAILELLAERDALRAERDAMAKDAERYRWMRAVVIAEREGCTEELYDNECDRLLEAYDAALQGANP